MGGLFWDARGPFIAVIRVERQIGEEKSVKRRYFISSLESDAQQLLQAERTLKVLKS